MLKTELKLPFVWYTTINKQHRFRVQNPGNEILALIAPHDRLLPFQIKRIKPSSNDTITEWKIYNKNDAQVSDLTSFANNIEVSQTYTDEYLTYKGGPLGINLAKGCYYSRIIKGGSVYFSEYFQPISDLTPYLRLEWWNTCDIPPVMYQTGYKNICYINSYTEPIPPDVNEEGEENGTGEFIPTLQRIVHKHKFELFGADYLLDAMSFMQIHDNIFLRDTTDSTFIQRVKTTPDYGDNYAGSCKVEFELPGDYIRTNCCTNIILIT